MPLAVNKSKEKNADVILADATERLLRATKERMLREDRRIDYEKLASEGFNAAIIRRLKAL